MLKLNDEQEELLKAIVNRFSKGGNIMEIGDEMEYIDYDIYPGFINLMSVEEFIMPLSLAMDEDLLEIEKFILAIIRHHGKETVFNNYVISAIFGIPEKEAEKLLLGLEKQNAITISKNEKGERILTINENYIRTKNGLINIAEEKIRYTMSKRNLNKEVI